nr:hypothetical protein [Tanacetum cinerariifolium]
MVVRKSLHIAVLGFHLLNLSFSLHLMIVVVGEIFFLTGFSSGDVGSLEEGVAAVFTSNEDMFKRRFGTPPPRSGGSPYFLDCDTRSLIAIAIISRRLSPSAIIGSSVVVFVVFLRVLDEKDLKACGCLKRYKVDIACYQETKWNGFSTREGNNYKLWYSDTWTTRNGVGVILASRLRDKVVHVNRCSDWIMSVSLVVYEETVNVTSACAPQLGQRCDLNGHIRDTTNGYSEVHRGFGYGIRNEEVIDTLLKRHQTRREVSVMPRIPWKNLNSKTAKAYRVRVAEQITAQVEDITESDMNQMWNTFGRIIRDEDKNPYV